MATEPLLQFFKYGHLKLLETKDAAVRTMVYENPEN